MAALRLLSGYLPHSFLSAVRSPPIKRSPAPPLPSSAILPHNSATLGPSNFPTPIRY